MRSQLSFNKNMPSKNAFGCCHARTKDWLVISEAAESLPGYKFVTVSLGRRFAMVTLNKGRQIKYSVECLDGVNRIQCF